MVWAAGQQIGNRYTIREVLGGSHWSITYRAEDQHGQVVVIKTANQETLALPEFDRFQQMFVKEAFKLARCNHPHIVKASEPFQFDGVWCIPMEYIAGTTLAKRDRLILPETEAVNYICQIGEALHVVHQHELLHRDVNPANIMMRIRNGQSEAVLIDFGLARDFDHDLTQTRTTEITPGFTPLELYSRDAERGAYTDIYSLGATLYELLTGKVPLSADKRKLSNVPLEFPQSVRQPIKQAIQWAMALEAKDRPQSVKEWLDGLGKVTSSQPVQPDSQLAHPVSQPASQSRWNWTVIFVGVAAIGTLLAGIAAIVPVFKSAPTPPPNPTQPR
jgi:eukaryotic-like serine/threonine-protein kinase